MTQLSVPQTISAYDNSIIGTPLASQEQCVRYLLSNNPNPDITVSPQQLVSYYFHHPDDLPAEHCDRDDPMRSAVTGCPFAAASAARSIAALAWP